MNASGQKNEHDGMQIVASTLAIARDVVVIAGIYLYFAGFMYKYYYYDSFHIKSVLDSVSPYVAFVYSYTVFWANRWALAIDGVICGLVLLIIAKLLAKEPETRKLVIGAFALVLALLAFPVLNRWSWKAADRDASETRLVASLGNDTSVTLLADKKALYGKDFLTAAAGEGLHILARTESYTYLLEQPPPKSGAYAKVTAVANSQIGSLYVDMDQ